MELISFWVFFLLNRQNTSHFLFKTSLGSLNFFFKWVKLVVFQDDTIAKFLISKTVPF